MKKIIALVCAATMLTACSFEPSEKDIASAVEKAIKESDVSKATGGIFGAVAGAMLGDAAKALSIKYISAKKVGCKRAEGKEGYVCEVAVKTSNPVTGEATNVDSFRFVKAGDEWIVAND